MVRLRHYTRVPSMRRIIEDGVIRARDQNKVFVERAGSAPLAPREAEDRYGLGPGKGNAYVEFDAEPAELGDQYNTRTRRRELFLTGDVDLTDRLPDGRLNH